MHSRFAVISFAVAVAVVGAIALSAQADTKSLRGPVTITSNSRTVAVSGKADTEFLFCIDQERSGTPQKIDFSGPAVVIYRPVPITGVPSGVTITGPENVANALTVIADDGRAWTFVGKGQQPLVAEGAKPPANPTRVNASVVRRLDWSGNNGRRRGTDVSGCLAPAG